MLAAADGEWCDIVWKHHESFAATSMSMEEQTMISRVVLLALAFTVAWSPPAAAGLPRRLALLTLDDGIEVGFNVALDSLPAHFRGNNFETIYRSLCIEPKGEFETTAQYEERRLFLPAKVYAFRLPTPSVQYDADRRTLTVTPNIGMFKEGWTSYSSGWALVVNSTRKTVGEFVGSNAFGASTIVTKEEVREWGIILDTPIGSGSGLPQIVLSMEPGRARLMKSRVALIAVCAVGLDNIPNRMIDEGLEDLREVTGIAIDSPTIDKPLSLTTYYYGLHIHSMALWIFDEETGKVLGKYSSRGERITAADESLLPGT